MHEWIKVVTQPLGLVGFGLFLVFGYLAKVKGQGEQKWLSPVAISLAAVALISGLALAYLQTPRTPSAPTAEIHTLPSQRPQQTNRVQQSSTGAGSPNLQGVQGDVSIIVDQSGTANAKRKETTQKNPDLGSH